MSNKLSYPITAMEKMVDRKIVDSILSELILLFLYQTLVDNKQHYFKSIFHRRLYLLDGLTKMVIVWYEVTYHQNATWRDWNVTFLIHIEHKTPKAFLDLGDQGLQRTIKSGRSVRSQYQKRTHTHAHTHSACLRPMPVRRVECNTVGLH